MESQKGDVLLADSWVVRKDRLNFIVCGVQLFHISFPALVLDNHQICLPNDLSAIQLPLEKLHRNLGTMVIPSFGSATAVPRISLKQNCICYNPEKFDNHWIEMDGTFKDYLTNLPKKHRHELLRKVRKFDAKFGNNTSFRVFRKPEEIPEFLDSASQISRKTYQEILLSSGLPSTDEYSRELTSLAAKDRVRGYLITVDNTPVAYGYCERQGFALNYNYTGFDPNYREWSPGIVLFYRILEDAFAEKRFHLLDLGSMKGQWKSSYVTSINPGNRVIFTRCFSRYVPLIFAHWIVKSASDFILHLITSLGLYKKLQGLLNSRERSAKRRIQGVKNET